MDEFTLTQHGNIYVVKVLKNIIDLKAKVIPFRIVIYKQLDASDMDYINLQILNKEGEDLRQFLRKHLLVYIDY